MVTENVTRHSSLGRLLSSVDYKLINTSDQCVNDTVVRSTINVFYLQEHDFQVKDVKVPCCSIYLKQTNKPLLLLLLACFTSQRRIPHLSWPADSSAKCLISCLSRVTTEWELLSCVMGLAFPHHSRRAHCQRRNSFIHGNKSNTNPWQVKLRKNKQTNGVLAESGICPIGSFFVSWWRSWPIWNGPRHLQQS